MQNLTPAIKTALLLIIALSLVLLSFLLTEQKAGSEEITLHGASQFDDTHTYSQALKRFTELVDTYYRGPVKVNFVLHNNSELGVEKDYFGYMNIGAVIDFAIVSPSHTSTFSRMATIMDLPFLFRDTDHYQKCLASGVFSRVEEDMRQRADVELIGYGGGEKRHFFGRRPVRNIAELKGFTMRVMGAPIQSRMFATLGATPTVIGSDEVYNALQTGVIEGAENSATAMQYFKWYEVAQDVSLAAVSFIVRPLFFSGKRFRHLPPDLQAAIRRAGAEAMVFERALEIAIDDPLMEQLEKEGKIKTHVFEKRDQLLELAAPVKAAFAEEIGATDILNAINQIQ